MKKRIPLILALGGALCCIALLIALIPVLKKDPPLETPYAVPFTLKSVTRGGEAVALPESAPAFAEAEPYLADLRTPTGKTDERGRPLYELNEAYLRQVMEQEDGSFPPSFYDALLITFDSLTVEQKERFITRSYLLKSSKRGFSLFGIGGSTCDNTYALSAVFLEMAARYQARVEAISASFEDLLADEHAIHEMLFNAVLLSHLSNGMRQAHCVEPFSSEDPDHEAWGVQVALEPVAEQLLPWDYVLRMPTVSRHVDAAHGEHNGATYVLYQHRFSIEALLDSVALDLLTHNKRTSAVIDRYSQTLDEGNAYYATHTGGCVIATPNGLYNLPFVYTDLEAFDAILTEYRRQGVDGPSAAQIAETIRKDGIAPVAEAEPDYLRWYDAYDGHNTAQRLLREKREGAKPTSAPQ